VLGVFARTVLVRSPKRGYDDRDRQIAGMSQGNSDVLEAE
jgi:hypothetical protein